MTVTRSESRWQQNTLSQSVFIFLGLIFFFSSLLLCVFFCFTILSDIQPIILSIWFDFSGLHCQPRSDFICPDVLLEGLMEYVFRAHVPVTNMTSDSSSPGNNKYDRLASHSLLVYEGGSMVGRWGGLENTILAGAMILHHTSQILPVDECWELSRRERESGGW